MIYLKSRLKIRCGPLLAAIQYKSRTIVANNGLVIKKNLFLVRYWQIGWIGQFFYLKRWSHTSLSMYNVFNLLDWWKLREIFRRELFLLRKRITSPLIKFSIIFIFFLRLTFPLIRFNIDVAITSLTQIQYPFISEHLVSRNPLRILSGIMDRLK